MAKPNPDPSRTTWRTSEVNLVKGTLKERRAEDQRRADAWRATREAELEAVVNRSYNGMDVPGIPELLTELHAVMTPYIEKFDRLFMAAYPAEFAKATIGLHLTPGGILPEFRDKIRRDAAVHLAAKFRFMMANIASHTTQTVANVSMRATNNPEVRDMLAGLATPNATTPTLDPPGPAIGVLARLLPHPEEWGLAGYEGTSPLLPAPDKGAETKDLSAPKRR